MGIPHRLRLLNPDVLDHVQLALDHSSNADKNSYNTSSRRLRCTAQLLRRPRQFCRHVCLLLIKAFLQNAGVP
jgi:hypothetical protein